MTQHDKGFDPSLGSLPNSPTMAPPSPSPSPMPSPSPVPPPPVPGSCQVCRATPTEDFTFRQVTGMFFRWKMSTVRGRYCGTCAQSLGRSVQAKTMVFGWLGLISAVVNLGVIPINSVGLLKAGRLPATANEASLDPGRPIFLRAGGAVGLIVIAVAAVFGIGALLDSSEPVDSLAVGDCLTDPGLGDFDRVETTSCGEPHDWEVYLSTTATGFGSIYPGDVALATHIDNRCYESFDAYVGAPYQESLYIYDFLFPTVDAWDAGDRAFLCIAGTGAEPIATSVRASGQ